MKMLEIKWDGQIVRIALESVRSYGIVKRPKVRKTPAHHVVKVVMQPLKMPDNEGRPMLLDWSEVTEWEYPTFEDAQGGVAVIDA